MKILHVPYCYYPDPVGGTEIYVDALANRQNRLGCEALVAAPAEVEASYNVRGLNVHRFAVSTVRDFRELYGQGDAVAAHNFKQILHKEKPDILHLHAFSRAVSHLLVREAQLQGIPVIFTYHTPTVSCQRGTLLRWGNEICDGRVDVSLCSSCVLKMHGVPRWIGKGINHLPRIVESSAEKLGLKGAALALLQMPKLISSRDAAFKQMTNGVDHIVAVANWVRDLLVINGVSSEKVTLCRQGLCHSRNPTRPFTSEKENALRIAFFGRMNPTKGVDMLIKALHEAPELEIKLDIFGVVQGLEDERYASSNKKLARFDSRISFRDPVAPEQVVSMLGHYDLVAVPSQWLETGPMIVLEAFAAGVPVIGSNLGGVSELVTEGVDGLLLQPDSVQAWADALRVCCRDRGLLQLLKSGISSPRTMSTVAEEMKLLYERVLAERTETALVSLTAAPAFPASQ